MIVSFIRLLVRDGFYPKVDEETGLTSLYNYGKFLSFAIQIKHANPIVLIFNIDTATVCSIIEHVWSINSNFTRVVK